MSGRVVDHDGRPLEPGALVKLLHYESDADAFATVVDFSGDGGVVLRSRDGLSRIFSANGHDVILWTNHIARLARAHDVLRTRAAAAVSRIRTHADMASSLLPPTPAAIAEASRVIDAATDGAAGVEEEGMQVYHWRTATPHERYAVRANALESHAHMANTNVRRASALIDAYRAGASSEAEQELQMSELLHGSSVREGEIELGVSPAELREQLAAAAMARYQADLYRRRNTKCKCGRMCEEPLQPPP